MALPGGPKTWVYLLGPSMTFLVALGILWFDLQLLGSEEERAKTELAVATDRSRNDALLAYFNQMGDLILKVPYAFRGCIMGGMG